MTRQKNFWEKMKIDREELNAFCPRLNTVQTRPERRAFADYGRSKPRYATTLWACWSLRL